MADLRTQLRALVDECERFPEPVNGTWLLERIRALASSPAAASPRPDALDVERLVMAIHRYHNPGSVGTCRSAGVCRRQAEAIAREYGALAEQREPGRG